MERITVKTTVNAPVEKAWEYYTNPDHVTKWNQASDDWHSPKGTNDLRVGGSFVYRMEPKNDPSQGFDFGGVYEEVVIHEKMSYIMSDNRKVTIEFDGKDDKTEITVTFDPETENSPEFQKEGWQAILDNYKKAVESN